jgi:predicted SAM-dependent methyltransferase
MKSWLERLLRRAGLSGFVGKSFWYSRLMWRVLAKEEEQILEGYLARNPSRKLHIGAGDHRLQGWLNTDIDVGLAKDLIYLDATKRFPFDDNVFDIAFSEHVIEHISREQGVDMLYECHRVLKPGGQIRIATPDLAFLIDLYTPNKSALQISYIEWATDTSIPCAPFYADTFVINNYVRNWGHQFIYDEKVLTHALRRAGFTDIRRYEIGKSRCVELEDLENQARLPDGFLQLETLVLEATKPASN